MDQCGSRYQPDAVNAWVCDQPAGHATKHEGPQVAWELGTRPRWLTWPDDSPATLDPGDAPEELLDQVRRILAMQNTDARNKAEWLVELCRVYETERAE